MTGVFHDRRRHVVDVPENADIYRSSRFPHTYHVKVGDQPVAAGVWRKHSADVIAATAAQLISEGRPVYRGTHDEPD